MTVSNSAAAFRVLELVSLLLPLVLILLQVSVRYYRNDEVSTLAIEHATILLSIAAAALVLVIAGVSSIDSLLQEGYASSIQTSLSLIRNALYLLVFPVVLMVTATIIEVAKDAEIRDSIGRFREWLADSSEEEEESNLGTENGGVADTGGEKNE